MEDVKRVFMYHGAEHKTVFAHENNEDLTVENVKKYSRLHPRCGTSFVIIVFIIAVFIFSLVDYFVKTNFNFYPFYLRLICHLSVLPFIASVSYEILRFSGKNSNNIFGKLIAWPGIQLQRITTKEPDEKQIEVAIEALKSALEIENNSEEK